VIDSWTKATSSPFLHYDWLNGVSADESARKTNNAYGAKTINRSAAYRQINKHIRPSRFCSRVNHNLQNKQTKKIKKDHSNKLNFNHVLESDHFFHPTKKHEAKKQPWKIRVPLLLPLSGDFFLNSIWITLIIWINKALWCKH
jgi:hypothetical protein